MNTLRTAKKSTSYTSLLFSLLFIPVINVHAMDINAKDALVSVGENTMTLKRVHTDRGDYIFNMQWDAASNIWKMDNYEPDRAYGWRPNANMSNDVDWAGSAVWGNTLYVIGGGMNWDTIRAYNSLTDTWTDNVVGDMGFILRAAAVSGNIYIFDTSSAKPNQKGWVYNIKTKKLSAITTSMPNISWTSEAAVYNGKLYFFGGLDSSFGPSNKTWEFDPLTATFTPKADMPTSGYAASSAVLNGKIYVIGGNYRNSTIDVYDPKTNTWQPSLNFPELSLLGWDTATALNGKIVIAAADRKGSTFVFDPRTKTLTAQEAMVIPHGDYLTGEGVGDRLYVAGGSIGRYSLDSFKPTGGKSTIKHDYYKSKMLPPEAPDYSAIQIMHKQRMEQLQSDAALQTK